MNPNISTREINVGVVGLGLMGSSVVTALLRAGHCVRAIAPVPGEVRLAEERIAEQLRRSSSALPFDELTSLYGGQLTISEDYSNLADCRLVQECVVEDISVKQAVYKKVTDVVPGDTVIASNTSAIPISDLQRHIVQPERFLGIHWAEPAYMTRFLEVTCGSETSVSCAEWVVDLAHGWGKEPTLLRKDIRGFVTNRLMYAIYREMFSIIEKGHASVDDVDKAFRYDAGSWMTLMGVFRRMDLVGVRDCYETFRNIVPTLCNDDGIPSIMQAMIDRKARGIQNGDGLYQYTAEEARAWDEAFAAFNADIYRLASRYPFDIRKESK